MHSIKSKYRSHYEWLDEHLPEFFKKMGVSWEGNAGIVSCHGDKFYQYREQFNLASIHFYHGSAMCLLSYCRPYSLEFERSGGGMLAWVIKNKERFIHNLPAINPSEIEERF